MQSVLALAFAASMPALGAAAVTQTGEEPRRALRPASAGVIQPLSYDQRLLVCNAYPSESPVLVKKNGEDVLADAERQLPFRGCRYASGRVQPHDKLDLSLRDVEIHGSFEVGTLPTSDALLLLVLEKRRGSTMVSFQSFAFPISSGRKDAQLALIDAFEGNASSPRAHLKFEDHINNATGKAAPKRVEELNFNRVYAIEAGTYDASVAELPHGNSSATEASLERHTRQTIRLAKDKHYVIIRTGDAEQFGESLVVFPPEDVYSGSQVLSPSWISMTVLGFLASAGSCLF